MSIERKLTVFERIDYIKENLKFVDRQVEELREEFSRIAGVLAEFYRAPLSMSSVQPIINLAVELNPELKTPRKAYEMPNPRQPLG